MHGTIRLARLEEVEAFVAHVEQADADSGEEAHFHPYGRDEPYDAPARVRRLEQAWALPLTEPGWRRAFVWEVDGALVGHLTLQGGGLRSELHRAGLGIGLMPAFRGRGEGRRLMAHAIAWARDVGLAWIDLGVFTDNPRAQRLYASLGFEVLGVRRDRFRIDGVSVDDVMMTLRL